MITSTSNTKIKHVTQIRKKRKVRDEEGLFLIEGLRIFTEAPPSRISEIYVTESFYEKERALVDAKVRESGCRMEILSDSVMSYAADTQHPQGVLCVVRQQEERREGEGIPLILVLEHIQDPGNLGTIFRTAEAAGVTEIILSDDCVDIYNPKVIRSTMGSIFRMPFLHVPDLPSEIAELKRRGVKICAAHLSGKDSYEKESYAGPTAFLIGNEGNGLSDALTAAADVKVLIPMTGQVESLNASIAAAVLMFEAARQRRNV